MIELIYPNPFSFADSVGSAIVACTENNKLLGAALQLNRDQFIDHPCTGDTGRARSGRDGINQARNSVPEEGQS